jgi:putative endonuclease
MKPQSTWWLYMIRCADNSLYTGITIDLDRRFAEHQTQGKKCAKYLRGKGPLALVFTTPVGTKSAASRLELRLKQCNKATKEKLVQHYRLGWASAIAPSELLATIGIPLVKTSPARQIRSANS